MAPPPDPTGDEFPDFDSMTPDEQMAWLESLARRQGASDDELTTAADLDIPVPEDVELDEPGYIPFEGSRSGREWADAHAAWEGQPSAREEPGDEEIEWLAPTGDDASDEAADPMRWLGSLAAQPGPEAEIAEPSGPWREDAAPSAEPEAVAQPWDLFDEEAPAQGVFEPEPLLPAAEPDFDLGAALAWEPLAEEEETPAPETFEVEEPFAEAERPPAPQMAQTPRPGPGAWDELEAAAAWDAEPGMSDDPLAGADPLTWLESVAKRQGAPEEELTTAADLEVAEPPEDVELTEPGYVPYSALGILPPDQEVPEEILAEAKRLAAQAEETEEAELELSEDVLDWLREIALEPEQDPAEYLAAADADEAERAAVGLSAEQELASLEREAARLAEARAAGEDAAALRAELPDWLQELRAAEVGEAPDVADWLAALDDERRGQAEAGAEGEAAPFDATGVSVSELEAFVAGGLTPASGELDPLAEALDDEYERLLAGVDDEPDWYTDAVARAASEETIAGGPVLAAAEPVDLPDWLTATGEESAAAEELPDWLAEVEPPAERDEAEAPEWLAAPTVEAPPPAPPPIKPEVPPALVRHVPLPEGAPFAPYRQRLEATPDDHPVRLELARSLRAHEALAQSLDQYEVLIEATQLLDDVTGDLQQLVEQYEKTPRVRRLLGDTYLRGGQLKDALDAYRAALERL